MVIGFAIPPKKEEEGQQVVLDRCGFEWSTKIHLRRMDGERTYGNQTRALCDMVITSGDKRRPLVKGEQVFWPPAKLCEKCDKELERLAAKNLIVLSRPKEREEFDDDTDVEISVTQQIHLPLGYRGEPHPKMDA